MNNNNKENLPILDMISAEFNASPGRPDQYSPLTLAYIGDAVFDLIVRTLLVEEKNAPVKKLHKRATEIVRAKTQADMILAIEGELTEEEMAIFKRGRNAKAASVAKNADIKDYRNATGFEALFGYLYLSKQLDRALILMKQGLNKLNLEVL